MTDLWIVDIPAAILLGWKFEDAHVRDDKPTPGPPR